MKLLVRQVEVNLDYTENEVIQSVIKRLKCSRKAVKNIEIIRRSLDTRPRRTAPVYVLSVEVELEKDFRQWPQGDKDIEPVVSENPAAFAVARPSQTISSPIVVGAGPAGLMAAFHLAISGYRPILVERGEKAENRRSMVESFWRSGTFRQNDNVLFGEGGAGLFSDGKLTARSKDRPRIRLFFETLVRCGAPREILIESEPHLGSDVLLKIIPNIRQLIEENGGEIRYNCRLTDISIENQKIVGVGLNGTMIPAGRIILATGHSARDIYSLLGEKQVLLQAKPFAAGIRLEIPQQQINAAQYGKFIGHPGLKAASFKLTRRPEGKARACYSFCMCPGGLVIACASEDGALTTNGMSYSGRDGIWGNAAFIVPIEPDDFSGFPGPEKHPQLAGINFQLAMEKAAFKAGGGGFAVPALMLTDFLAGKVSDTIPANRSCQRSIPASFDQILPDYVLQTLRSAIPCMLKELNGASIGSALVYAAETRSSSPVRIVRNEEGQSPTAAGLFPAGEGAGYAGGIVSSAVDGLKAAEALIASLVSPA
jgi:uncharacterized FAD-dependent dehydrogenase